MDLNKKKINRIKKGEIKDLTRELTVFIEDTIEQCYTYYRTKNN